MDLNTNAFRIVQSLASGNERGERSVTGRAGGLKGGPARAARLSSEERRQIAKNASQARWAREQWQKDEKKFRKGGKKVSEKLLKNIEELVANIDDNDSRAPEHPGKSDLPPSVSKYHGALQRLAQE